MDEFDTLIGLVSQYSPSGQERGAVDWLVARMKSHGYGDAFIDDAGNAVGVMGKGPKQIVLLGHIDTVRGEIPVRVEPLGSARDASLLFGRGAVDAKGPLACFVDAVTKVGNLDGWQFVVIGAVETVEKPCFPRSTTYVRVDDLCMNPCVQGCGLWITDCPQALSTGYPPVIHRVRPPSGDNSFRTSLTFCRPRDHSSDVSTALPHVFPRGYPQTVDEACVQCVVVSLLVTGR